MATATANRADLFTGGSVTIAGLNAKYGIGKSKAYELMSAGLLPWSMVYGRRLIPCKAVEDLLASGLGKELVDAVK